MTEKRRISYILVQRIAPATVSVSLDCVSPDAADEIQKGLRFENNGGSLAKALEKIVGDNPLLTVKP